MLKYQKFQVQISKWDVLSKNDQMLWFMQKPNEKLLSFVIILLWEVIYVHFYNWDSPLDLVPIVYGLIELIIENSLWSKDFSTFDTHPQHTRLCSNNPYLIYVIVYVQMRCVSAQPYMDQTKKFLVLFVCYWMWFVSHMYFKIFQIVFVWKICFLGVFVTYFMCMLSWVLNGPILKFFSFGQRVSWLFRGCFASKAYQRNTSKILKLTSETTSENFQISF